MIGPVTLLAAVIAFFAWMSRHVYRTARGWFDEITDVADDLNAVAWTSPVDDEWFEVRLPVGVSQDDVWATLAWIGRLPEVTHA